MISFAKKTAKSFLSSIASSRIQADLVNWMARSGVGTDKCLERGSLPLPVHYYSPVPDVEDLKRRDAWTRRSPMYGVDLRSDEQIAHLLELGRRFGAECDWPADKTCDSSAFYTENDSFSFGCAAAAHCVVRDRKPRRLIEVGSGMSSMILSDALRMNAVEGSVEAEYTVIDPYPSSVLGHLTGVRPTVIDERVELVDLAFFEQLEAGDVLFVDSGHVVRIGGDVNFMVLDVLPRLQPGVVVHFHDIALPYEYPEAYLTNPEFRMLWTEAYLLQAFLAFNSEFEILLGMSYLMRDQMDSFREAFEFFDPAAHVSGSGSLWIVRR